MTPPAENAAAAQVAAVRPVCYTRGMGEPTSVDHVVVSIRVRYVECDPMNLAHHSSYAVWLEMARTELLRQRGVRYRDIEAKGIYLVVARLNVRYRKPIYYDDLIEIHCRVQPPAGVKIEHRYEVRRDGVQVATAETTIVAVDDAGRMQRPPAEIL